MKIRILNYRCLWVHAKDTDTSGWYWIVVKIAGKLHIVKFPSVKSAKHFIEGMK